MFKWNSTSNRFGNVRAAYCGCGCLGGTTLTTNDLHTIRLVPGSSDVFAGGIAGTILHYSPSSPGTGWTTPKSFTTKDILGMSFLSSTQGYLATQTIAGASSSDNGDNALLLYY
jgi:hypothetical protein